jgi:phosphoglycerol transferase MdoB-like AlkP superfamily enzyme
VTPRTVQPIQRSLLLIGLGLAPFLLARLLLLVIYFEDFEELGALRILGAFVAGLRFDLAALLPLIVVPVGMLTLPLPFARDRRWTLAWGWLAFAVVVACTLVLAGDLLYYRDVRRHFARELILAAHDGVFVAGMFVAYWYLALLFLVFAATLGWVWKRALALELADPLRKPWLQVLVLGGLIACGIRGSAGRKPLNPTDAYRGQSFEEGSLLLNGVFTAVKAMVHDWEDIENPMPEGEAYAALGLDPEAPYPVLRPAREATPTGINLVVILLESWDTRYIRAYEGERSGEDLTPCFDALATESLQFEQAYAATQRTIGGVQAVLTGIPAVPGVPELSRGLEHTSTTRFAKLAKAHGYSTMFLQGPRRSSFYLDAVAMALGFDVAYGKEDVPLRRDYGGRFAKWGWDYDALMFSLDRMDAMKPPFFSFVLTGTSHSPYADPGKEFHKRPHADGGEDGYVNTLHYSDWALGEFFKAAKQKPWYDDTVFLICADHVYRSDKSQHMRMNFRVPMLLHGKGITPGKRGGVRSQVDALPTFMELCGFGDAYASVGTSLLAPEGSGAALVKRGNVLGIVAEYGDMSHSLQDRLSTRILAPSDDDAARLDALERRLLATHRVTQSLVLGNRWAP